MTQPCQFAPQVSPAPPTTVEIEQSCLEILFELEASLLASHRAILDRDVARLEELTQLQGRLRRLLSDVLPGIVGRIDRELPVDRSALQMAAGRVLELGRVQLAMLRRSRRSLVILANLAAGAEAGYAAAAESSRTAPR